MTVVAIKCAKCGVKLGIIDNIWLKLGNDHIALITDANTDLEIDFEDPDNDEKFPVAGINNDLILELLPTGDVWQGERGTFIAHSKLRDVMCASCSAPVGLQCIEPHVENHALAKNQYIFFVKAVILKSVEDGRRRIEPEIQQAFTWTDNREQLRSPGQMHSSSPQPSEDKSEKDDEDQDSQSSEVDVDIENEEVPQEYLLDPEVTSALQSVVSAFGRDIKQLHDGLRETQAEVKRLRTENQDLRTELVEAKNQAELAHKTAEAASSNFLIFKDDIEKLMACLESYSAQPSASAPTSQLPTRMLKRPSVNDHDDETIDRPLKRVAMTPEVSAVTSRYRSGTGGSQRSSPIVSSASRRNGLLTRPARRSSGLFGSRDSRDSNDQEMEESSQV
ncbi:hypothetical protein BGZ63DRAFT_418480 [Mariannaea sp. PMI_226]|nr:hypothetical protein BGZ63DRAFT_418480 [Mariannaea sp. PMI_226]